VAGSKEGTEERAALDSITSAARSLWSRSRWRWCSSLVGTC